MKGPGYAFGVPGALPLVLATRLITLFGAPITLVLVTLTLTDAERGFYFIFINTQALTALSEFGFGTVLIHFVSHEYAALGWSERGCLEGNPSSIGRIAGILSASARFYSVLAAVLAVLAFAIGLAVFGLGSGVPLTGYLVPWLIVTGMTGLYLPLVPFLMALEGCGKLFEVQRMRVVQVIADLCTLWLTIPLLGGLQAVACLSVVHFLIAAIYLQRTHGDFWRQMRAVNLHDVQAAAVDTMSTRALKLVQRRALLTWITGYATTQCLVPIAFAASGAGSAGQLGLSLALATAPYTLGLAFLQARQPEYAARRQREGLAALRLWAGRTTWLSVLLCVTGTIVVLMVVVALNVARPDIARRLLPFYPMAVLCAASLGSLVVQAIGLVIRSNREEPFLSLAVVSVVAVLTICVPSAVVGGGAGVALGYSFVVLTISLPFAVCLGYRQSRAFEGRAQA